MIGSEALARELATFPWTCTESNGPDWRTGLPRLDIYVNWEVAPEGWRLLGTGTTRYAYLGPDNVVYKIVTNSLFLCPDPKSCDDMYCPCKRLSANLVEAYAYETEKDRVSNVSGGKVRLAECHYFYDLDIVAMERSEKINDTEWSMINTLANEGYGGDLHPGNIWDDKKGTVIIDYGHFSD